MSEGNYSARVRAAAAALRRKAPGFRPEVAVVLGSGLAGAVPSLDETTAISYRGIPGFPRPTVPGHEGRLILGRAVGRGVAVLQGRFHYYEGHAMEDIALPLRALRALGLETLIVTAAVGSLRKEAKPGHFVVVSDHINLMGANPLRGFHQKKYGTMFPSLLNAYDPALRRALLAACRRAGAPAREGVYAALSGPSYETPAEIRALRRLGADVVGMSVAPEVIPARQMGVRAAALAWVSNMAAGLPGSTQDHAEVLALGGRVSRNLRGVLSDFLRAL
ncbi:MAG: purine-nucleoside phosphorylase [Elusimicrobia bacterium]|nr:purine-nucleoside phosphorylase [Elusimicrobiota bacterium]